jgi:hypothetical protein
LRRGFSSLSRDNPCPTKSDTFPQGAGPPFFSSAKAGFEKVQLVFVISTGGCWEHIVIVLEDFKRQMNEVKKGAPVIRNLIQGQNLLLLTTFKFSMAGF